MVEINRQADAALNEYFRNLAVTHRAVWGGHSGLYGQFRSWLQGEMAAQKLGMAVMFPSIDDLVFQAEASKWKITSVGSHGDAIVLRTPYNSEQLWVLASSERYRDALLTHYGHLRKKPSADLHREAELVLTEVATDVGNKKLRKDLDVNDRQAVVAALVARANNHVAAAPSPSQGLLSGFDCTLDVDHVLSAKSLQQVSGAWVLLFPVPAHTNRRYGAKVERFYKRLSPESSAKDISAELMFKLLAGMIPDTPAQLAVALARVQRDLRSFDLDPEKVDMYITRMEMVMKNILKLDKVKNKTSRRPPAKGKRSK